MQLLGPKANADSPESDLTLFQQFLADPGTSIPVNSNFIVFIESFPLGLQSFTDSQISQFEPNKWAVSETGDKLTAQVLSPAYNGKCFFVNGITLPNESIGSKRVGLAEEFGDLAGGVLSGVVSTSRASKGPLRATFLETTDSFIDAVLRPWVVAVSHYGLFARAENSAYNVKTNIKVAMYNSRTNKREVQRKVYTFFECAPISFEAESLTWGRADTKTVATEWVYNYYTIETGARGEQANTAAAATLTSFTKNIRATTNTLPSFTSTGSLIPSNIPLPGIPGIRPPGV
jgi:hypothetical protein